MKVRTVELTLDYSWKPMDPVRDIEEHSEFWNTVTDPRIWEELNLGDILRPNPQQGELVRIFPLS
ncbi:hypothetical protein CPB86DRAFT_783639 [Serendipita vermifera]|nr:hypothetical protein CPB86DRAFT_783639 [Serendipita vermifera]